MYDIRTVLLCAVMAGPFYMLLVLVVFAEVWHRLFRPPEDKP